MVRKMLALVCGLAMISMMAVAEDKKEEKKSEKVTLEGKLVCTKCELKETKACGHALLVKDKDDDKKEIKYYIKDKGAKEPYHPEVCQEPKPAKVTGKVVESKKDDKTIKTIEDAKVEIKK